MKGITDIFRTYLNSGCKRIIIPCFGYDPDKFLDNISHSIEMLKVKKQNTPDGMVTNMGKVKYQSVGSIL